MRSQFLPFSPPPVGEEEIAEVTATLRSGWLTTGPRAAHFEAEFAAQVGAPGALALNSGTSALQVALAVLGVGAGDTVISTPMTFCSSIHVIEHAGARPLLVDVEPDTLNIDPALVESALRSRARESASGRVAGILPVHLYGHPCEIDPILDLARHYRLVVIEDAAHAFPASYQGRPVGTPRSGYDDVPDLVAFSFYATKNITTGEGGMLTGPVARLDEARVWSLHGMSRDAHARYTAAGSWRYDVVAPGFKANMPDLQAALGIQQLRKLPRFQQRRRAIAGAYNQAFASLDAVETPVERSTVSSAWHIYALRLRLEMLRIGRDEFIEALKALNIGSSVHFIPVHLLSYYRDRYGLKPGDFPVANREFARLVSLPLNPTMTDTDAQDVIEAVSDLVQRHRR